MNLYNIAIEKLKLRDYKQANRLLKEALLEQPQSVEILWALGLSEIYLGNPFNAEAYWEKIEPKQFHISEKIKLLESYKPKYEEIYEKFNESIAIVKSTNYDQAFIKLSELMENEDILPPRVYIAYANLAAYLNKSDEFTQQYEKFPKHIQYIPEIVKIVLYIDSLQKNEMSSEQISRKEHEVQQLQKSSKTKNFVMTILAIAITAAVVTLGISFADIGEQKEGLSSTETDEVKVADETSTENEKDVVDTKYKQQIDALNQEINKLQNELDTTTVQVQQWDDKNEILQLAGQSVDDEIIMAEKKLYTNGYAAYTNGHYENAITLLENSWKYNMESYFADDALYYTIKAKKKLSDESYIEDYEEFLNNATSNFLNSSYYDDVLYEYSKSLIQQGNLHEAKQYLTILMNDYTNEWTGIEANRLLKEMAE